MKLDISQIKSMESIEGIYSINLYAGRWFRVNKETFNKFLDIHNLYYKELNSLKKSHKDQLDEFNSQDKFKNIEFIEMDKNHQDDD